MNRDARNQKRLPAKLPALALLAGLLAGCGTLDTRNLAEEDLTPSGKLQGTIRVIEITAMRYRFSPNLIVVYSGEPIRLLATSTDVTHGFNLEAYRINRVLRPRQTEEIEFTAGKPGSYWFNCSVYCGLGHFSMTGRLVVLPPKSP